MPSLSQTRRLPSVRRATAIRCACNDNRRRRHRRLFAQLVIVFISSFLLQPFVCPVFAVFIARTKIKSSIVDDRGIVKFSLCHRRHCECRQRSLRRRSAHSRGVECGEDKKGFLRVVKNLNLFFSSLRLPTAD